MAVQRRLNVISQQRIDVPDMRSIESAASNDWDQGIQAIITGAANEGGQGYFIRGFNILMAGAIGGASNALLLKVDPGAILHIAASQSGTVLMVPTGTPNQVLNAAINTNVTGAFSPSSVNYVTLDYTRFVDDTTNAQVYIWDPTTNTETTEIAPRAIILEYVINISTVTPTSNLLPIAVVTTDAGNNVLSITDARWLLGRLGTGGTNPNPFYLYPWPDGREENPPTSTSNSSDPFNGGDKDFVGLKDWMNAVMSILQEIKGTTYWYSVSSSGSLESLREDLGNTVITSSGNIAHGIIPNSNPILVTTGNTSANVAQITGLASTAGLVVGQYVFGTGIKTNSTILEISGSTVYLSQPATLTLTGASFSFYDSSVITEPGQINWSEPINIRVIGSELDYVLAANLNSTDITLADDYAAYLILSRNETIIPNLIFTNGIAQVSSVGNVAWTSNLEPGDFIKLASDTSAGYYEIETVNSSTQVTLTETFSETSTGAAGTKAVYALGNYYASPTPSGDPRAIQIATRETVPQNENMFWLFLRNDNGGDPRVYIRFLGAELDDGDDIEVSGPTSNQLLQYVGSPTPGASQPQYVSALEPNSVPQITLLSFGAESTVTANSYFLINSSNNARRYYVWFNLNGGGTDPNPGGGVNDSIEVSLTTGQTAAQVVAAVAFALNSTPYGDFIATQQTSPNTNEVSVTNASAGEVIAASIGTMAAPFSVSTTQTGTGAGNNVIQDGDNLTLAIKILDTAIGNFLAAVNEPSYDETITIVSSGGTYPGTQNPPMSINGPISSSTVLPLPNNSRLSDAVQKYAVGQGFLQVFLNGQKIILGADWNEVGASGSLSNSFEILRTLVVGDVLELRISGLGGGAGGGGEEGPPGPTGPEGPPGADAAGGPVAISTKTSTYSVQLSDNVLLANCTSGTIYFYLPSASTAVGRVYYFKKIDSTSNQMIIQASGSQLIDSANTLATAVQYEAFTMISDGTQWWLF